MPIKVLVADDNRLLLAMTRDALVEAGYDVTAVESGLEVYQQVVAKRPQIVLLDIMMPGIDGIEVCRNLKRSPVTRGIVIVIHSGKTDMALMDLCFAAGAEAYIIKTNDFESMVKRINEIARERILAPDASPPKPGPTPSA